jgi:antirestriction protein ArdC
MNKATQVYENLTNEIIDRLKKARAGECLPSFGPMWTTTSDGGMPRNMTTGRAYTGTNILILWFAAIRSGFTSNEWMTVPQLFEYAKKNNLEVSFKGQKTTRAIRVVDFIPKGTDPSEENPFVRTIRTFDLLNRCQVQGLPAQQQLPPIDMTRTDVQQYIRNTRADIKHGSNRACYHPMLDYIELPHPEQFATEDDYYAVALHELGHWTGHKARLKRQFGMDKKGYAKEELIAELTATFLCGRFQIGNRLRHIDYIDTYIQHLADDFSLIREAATAADKAVQLLDEWQASTAAAAA